MPEFENGELSHLWVVSTYRDLQKGGSDSIIKLQLRKGQQAVLVESHDIDSVNTHSALRAGNKLLVANTAQGSVDEYSYPGMVPGKKHELFKKKDWINCLALNDPDGKSFWV